jgi:hypothetical protein
MEDAPWPIQHPKNPDTDYPLRSDVIDLIVPIPPEILAELHRIAVREGMRVASVALSGIEILLGQHRAGEAHDDDSADR